MPRIPFQDLPAEIHRVLIQTGLPEPRAVLVARLFSENQRDGIYSHGLNRFSGFVPLLKTGQIDLHADPEKIGGLGAIEQWDGKSQVFIAIKVTALAGESGVNEMVDAIVDNLHTAAPLADGETVRYPDEGMLRTRQESLEKGVLADEAQLAELLAM